MVIENEVFPGTGLLLVGGDGGGTRCCARLSTLSGTTLAEAVAGPANIRYGMEKGFAAVFQAGTQCLTQAGLSTSDSARIVACLGLAGASEPSYRAAAQRHRHPYRDMVVTTDAHAACVGAHAGRDGAVIVVGTGSIGWAEVEGRQFRFGGWGLAVSGEGSRGRARTEALRPLLRAPRGPLPWARLP